MVWPFSSSSNNKDNTTSNSDPLKTDNGKFLEDLPPKFEDAIPPPNAPHPSSDNGLLKPALSSIQPDDFLSLHKIPCFRDAILAGGTVSAVVFAVLVTTRMPVRRAMNWGVGGFAVGSIGSWERCRMNLRREKKEVMMAREMYKRGQVGVGSSERSDKE